MAVTAPRAISAVAELLVSLLLFISATQCASHTWSSHSRLSYYRRQIN